MLTPRLHQILLLVSQGQSHKEIAAQLGLSLNTVDSHVKRILTHFGAKNSPHAVALFYEKHCTIYGR